MGDNVFDIVGKHQCFKSGEGSYGKPVERMKQFGGVGERQKIAHNLHSCILDGLQRLCGAQRQTFVGVTCSSPVSR